MRLLLLFSLFNLCLGHYKWKDTSLFFGWYGYNPDVMEGWTNLGYSLNLTLLVNNANKGINQLYELNDMYIDTPNGLILSENWTEVITDEIIEMYNNRTIIGFFMGDELMWDGLSYNNLTLTAEYVRFLFPNAFIWENEGANVFKCNKTYGKCINGHNRIVNITDGIPPGLSVISVDMYHMNHPDSKFVSVVKQFYQTWIYPKLHNHQRAFTVPGSFASNFNPTCNFNCYDRMCAEDAMNYYSWALEDPLITGMVPWTWYNCTTCQKFEDEIGTKYMNITKTTWNIIGDLIVN